jgi:hypothetical protein
MSDNPTKRAFPLAWVDQSNPSIKIMNIDNGMSLRDYFAAKAMESLIFNTKFIVEKIKIEGYGEYNLNDVIANSAFEFADAMLKAREK